MTTTVLYDGILSSADGVMLDVGDYESVAVQITRVPFVDPADETNYPTLVSIPYFSGSADGKQWSKIRILDGDNPDFTQAVQSDSGPGIFYLRSALASVLQWFMVQVRPPLGASGVPVHTFKVTVTGARR